MGLRRGGAGAILAATMLVTSGPATALAAEVRLVHAVPAAAGAQLSVGGRELGSPVGFGEAGGYTSTRSGGVRVSLVPGGGGKALATRTLSLRNGRYTVVAAPSGSGVVLRSYRDGSPRDGTARVRAIHAAGEIDEADLKVDEKTVARDVKPGAATPYLELPPGSYSFAMMRPGGGGDPLASKSGVELVAGTSSTAVVVGSGGEPTRMVLAPEGSSAPAQGPDTGLGGMDDGPSWVLALLAALLAGSVGVGVWRHARSA